ncbi:hypothetical protein NVP1154O_40 [Vibrio phage 1.154.O._10N.222.52.B12]|nr:hypothetical protein NVP1154O_40 [Vibrio phage 1.154.O._10N.222.52.B12]
MATKLITTERIPMSIPKKKRAQLIRIQQQKVRRQLDSYYLVWDPLCMEYVTPYNSNGEKGVMTQGFVDALKHIEVKWRIHCYILGRERNGKERVDGFTLDINTPCKHDDIKNIAADKHWEFIEEYRKSPRSDNFVSATWIATTRDEVDNELACRIFKEAGSFELLADWQEPEYS